MPKVKVACRIVNGIKIKRYRPGPDDGGGKQPPVPIDGGITLTGPSGLHGGAGNPSADGQEPGLTLVDREWIEAWLEENAQTEIVRRGHVAIMQDSEVPDEESAQDPKPEHEEGPAE